MRYPSLHHNLKKLQGYDAVFFKLVGMWNRMSEVADAMIAVTKSGYRKPAIECRDISKLAKR